MLCIADRPGHGQRAGHTSSRLKVVNSLKIRNLALLSVSLVSLMLGLGFARAYADPANEATGFRDVRLWVYPEYDGPRLLVPSAAEMYSAGSMDTQGQYSGGPPDTHTRLGRNQLSIQLKTDTFRVEYYDPVITSQPDKKISYYFRWLYPIADLRVLLQQPKNATNFTVLPAGGTPTSEQGVNALLYEYTSLKDNPLHFDIAYTRSDPNPSLPRPAASAPPNTALVPAIVIGLGLLIAGGFVWALRSRKATRPQPKVVPVAATGRAPSLARRKKRFCTRCGEPVDNQSRFCRHCGARLRNFT